MKRVLDKKGVRLRKRTLQTLFGVNVFAFTILWIVQSIVFGEIRYAQGFPGGHWMLVLSDHLGLVTTFIIKFGLWIPFCLTAFFVFALTRSGYGQLAVVCFAAFSAFAYWMAASFIELGFDKWLNIKIPNAVNVFYTHQTNVIITCVLGYLFGLALIKIIPRFVRTEK